MKRALQAALALLFLTGCAFGQVSATNGVVTLTPSYGSTAFVPGASIFATGRAFHEGTQGYADPLGLKGRFSVTVQPGNVSCHIVQVEPARLWFFIPLAAPVGMTSVTISLRDPYSSTLGSGPIIWSEVIPLTITRTAPQLTGSGQWISFRSPILRSFSGGVLTLTRGVGTEVVLFAGNLGGITDWVVEIVGDGVNFGVLGLAEPINQARPENIQFQVPLLPAGTYRVRVYPIIDPEEGSNTITLVITQ